MPCVMEDFSTSSFFFLSRLVQITEPSSRKRRRTSSYARVRYKPPSYLHRTVIGGVFAYIVCVVCAAPDGYCVRTIFRKVSSK